VYKSAKHSSTNTRHAHVDDADDDTEAGPAPPPDNDDAEADDYGPSAPPDDDNEDDLEDEVDEDTEGRFFGGGISRKEREILDYMTTAGPAAADGPINEKIDAAWLRKTALAFEKKITLNSTLRARYEAEPAKFIDSEADLDAAIKALSILSENPALYPDFVKLGSAASLVSLLAHENTDIALDAVEIIGELTDEDVEAEEEDWAVLVDALLEADLLGLVVSTFGRLDEAQETDREGVYRALGVVENLCSNQKTAELVGKEEGLVRWLVERAGREEKPVGQNKQYAAEILAILVQGSEENRRRLAGLDAVDAMLQLVAAYRKRDPEKGGNEEEYMENLFEALTSLVDEAEGKAKFVEAEGVELCLLMAKEGKKSKYPAFRLLDHAVGGPAGAEVCKKLVEAGGLKILFTTLMKGKPDRPTLESLVDIFASMLRLLPADSAERIRTLAKFVEKNYEKTERLVEWRRKFAGFVAAEDKKIDNKLDGMDGYLKEADVADERFLARLDAGLFTLRTIDVVLAWLVAEDDGARKKIQALLADRDETFAVIRESLQERVNGINAESEESKETKEMLTTLMQFLQ
jgi:beta-catenin-like protein 1